MNLLFKKTLLLIFCLTISVQPIYCWNWNSIVSSATSFLSQIERKTVIGIGVIFGIAALTTGYMYRKNSPAKPPINSEKNDDQDNQLSIQKVKLVNRNTFFQNVIGVSESKFQENIGIIKKSIIWNADQNSFFLRNSLTGKLFRAGNFTTISIGALRHLTKNKKVSLNEGRFNIIEAVSPLNMSYYKYVDIGSNQANPKNRDAVFQVASNFNALELASNADDMRDIGRYTSDKSQGPFASISATPGTILRHYYMFYNSNTEPSTWQQYAILNRLWQKSDAKIQINLLEDTDIPVVNSYVNFDAKSPEQVKNYKVEDIKVGWHEGIQVTSGLMADTQHTLVDDPQQIINQVFTAAVAFDFSNYKYINKNLNINIDTRKKVIDIAQAVQKAAYEGTVRTAVAYDKKKVYLTLIGGGVFNNDLRWVGNAINNDEMQELIKQSGIDATLIIYDSNSFAPNEFNNFKNQIADLVLNTGGKYKKYSPDFPKGKILGVKDSLTY